MVVFIPFVIGKVNARCYVSCVTLILGVVVASQRELEIYPEFYHWFQQMQAPLVKYKFQLSNLISCAVKADLMIKLKAGWILLKYIFKKTHCWL